MSGGSGRGRVPVFYISTGEPQWLSPEKMYYSIQGVE